MIDETDDVWLDLDCTVASGHVTITGPGYEQPNRNIELTSGEVHATLEGDVLPADLEMGFPSRPVALVELTHPLLVSFQENFVLAFTNGASMPVESEEERERVRSFFDACSPL